MSCPSNLTLELNAHLHYLYFYCIPSKILYSQQCHNGRKERKKEKKKTRCIKNMTQRAKSGSHIPCTVDPPVVEMVEVVVVGISVVGFSIAVVVAGLVGGTFVVVAAGAVTGVAMVVVITALVVSSVLFATRVMVGTTVVLVVGDVDPAEVSVGAVVMVGL